MPTPSDLTTPSDLSALCQELFSSFARTDQRRWGEVYVEGLVTVPGRKSLRRIAEDVVGWRADQCLQQFVNQSPWAWEPVRSRLAHHLTAELRPRAWVVEEAVFPKNGDASVGVAKQYARSAGGMRNCQLGLAVSLVGDDGGSPVNWRLLLPPSWSKNDARRARSHLPAEERHRTRTEHLLNALDEMVVDWELPVAPVVVDAHQESPVEPLLSGLEERGLRYLVRVPSSTAVAVRPIGIGTGSRSGPVPTRMVPVAELAAQAIRRGGRTLNLSNRTGDPRDSQFVAVGSVGTAPAPTSGAGGSVDPRFLAGRSATGWSATGGSGTGGLGRGGSGTGRPYLGARQVVAQWSPRRHSAEATWLTNLNLARLPDLVQLIRLARRTADELEQMGDDCGLRHFEGRSYRGWQHHVTLASVAHAYRLLCQLHERCSAEPTPAAG
jgi:SRSO17 transposase